VKPHVQRKVDAFEERYFESRYVAGVHYRGTDKGNEAPKVAYEVVEAAIQQEIADHSDAVIFVATDEQQCLDHLRAAFGARVVFIDALRSANYEPIHHLNGGWAATDRYALEEEALIDCMLLSRSNVIIRTQSNLSSSAGNINPIVPVVDLNRATYHHRPALSKRCAPALCLPQAVGEGLELARATDRGSRTAQTGQGVSRTRRQLAALPRSRRQGDRRLPSGPPSQTGT
jgi:hypothetical protein